MYTYQFSLHDIIIYIFIHIFLYSCLLLDFLFLFLLFQILLFSYHFFSLNLASFSEFVSETHCSMLKLTLESEQRIETQRLKASQTPSRKPNRPLGVIHHWCRLQSFGSGRFQRSPPLWLAFDAGFLIHVCARKQTPECDGLSCHFDNRNILNRIP